MWMACHKSLIDPIISEDGYFIDRVILGRNASGDVPHMDVPHSSSHTHSFIYTLRVAADRCPVKITIYRVFQVSALWQ